MRIKTISSLEKCFLDESIMEKPQLARLSALKNERCSFQICFDAGDGPFTRERLRFRVESALNDCIRVYKVRNIPSEFPCYPDKVDDNYLRTEPGLYPDLLEPLMDNDHLPVRSALQAVWVEISLDSSYDAGVYPVKGVFLRDDGSVAAETSVQIEIITAALPEQQLIVTQWFYPDCLMDYYGVEMYSEAHWQIIEAFMRNASRYGQNMILTPVISPELDTYVGGYRPATQLVDITLENGAYSFDFDKLGRWIELCDRTGIRYFEINHFFSQWGAAACPQVIVTENGEKKRIFGWDVASDADSYAQFLRALIPELLGYLKTRGVDQRCFFHISDEPKLEQIERYTKASSTLKELLQGYPMIDALSRYEFYENGLVQHPIPAVNHMEPFLEHEVPELWTYYCCMQCQQVSNRFFSMPSARNRIIGTQLYKFRIAGFLQWGFNFYNTQLSYGTVNPFQCSDTGAFLPSGDPYVVYPGPDGTPWPSLRQVVFHEALQDLRALQLCEQLHGRDYTMKLLEDGIAPITFSSYPHDAQYLLNLRCRVNEAIKEKTMS